MNRLGWVLLLIVLLVSTAGVQASGDYRASRIELKDGKVFNNVSFSTDTFDRVIRVKSGGTSRAINFDDILLILDVDGRDVSRDILGQYYSPTAATGLAPEKAAMAPPDKYWIPSPPELWSVRFSLQPDFSIPIGNFYNGVSSGLGVGGEISLRLSRHFALRGMLSRAGLKDDYLAASGIDGFKVRDDNSKFSAWRYSIDVEYHNWPRYAEGGKSLYYFYSGIGQINHSLSGDVIAFDPLDNQAYLFTLDFSESEIMLNTGLGLMMALSPEIGLNFGADFYAVFVGKTGNYSEYLGLPNYFIAYNLDFRVGFVFYH